MNYFGVVLAICCLATSLARPTYEHWGHSKHELKGVPDESHYGKLTYPHFDVIPLGTAIKGHLPPAIVQITKTVKIKEPQPYPVKVPVPVPHPVEVAKPYPVIQTKIIKVPHPVPYEVVKKVPVPFEVPKPYPVPSEEFKAPHEQAQVASFGGLFGSHEQLAFQNGGEGRFGGGEHEGYEAEDQAGAYGTQVQQPSGWVPVNGGSEGNNEQQEEEQH